MREQLFLLGLFVSLCSAADTFAGTLLVPNGNPTGRAWQVGTGGAAFLDPVQAIDVNTTLQVESGEADDLLSKALTAEGFNFTLDYHALEGNDLTLGTYLAWADTRPAVTQGAFTLAGTTVTGSGGAEFGLNYAQNNAADPQTTNTHWVQILIDNRPLPFELAHGIADPYLPGYTLSVDNPFAPRNNGNPTTPFYDAGGAANSTDFLDVPTDGLNSGTDLIFYTFLVTQNGNTLNVYDGVQWGVDLSPEPASLVIWGIGLGGLAVTAARRRKSGQRESAVSP